MRQEEVNNMVRDHVRSIFFTAMFETVATPIPLFRYCCLFSAYLMRTLRLVFVSFTCEPDVRNLPQRCPTIRCVRNRLSHGFALCSPSSCSCAQMARYSLLGARICPSPMFEQSSPLAWILMNQDQIKSWRMIYLRPEPSHSCVSVRQ